MKEKFDIIETLIVVMLLPFFIMLFIYSLISWGVMLLFDFMKGVKG